MKMVWNKASGKKLIVKVPIKDREGFWGGNNIPTNDETTAIYSGEVSVIRFPMPEVNVPIKPTISTTDKTIYYGGDVTSEELLNEITVGGKEVTVNDDGTFTPLEDWMDDFADLNWTETSTKPNVPLDDTANNEPGDYTYSVTLTPKYDGEENRSDHPSNMAGTPVETTGETVSSTAHVYIKVPVITFKDSTIHYGMVPDDRYYENNDFVIVEWVFSDNTDTSKAPDISGTAPELTFTYTPSGNLAGDNEIYNFVVDTKIDVTVTSSNTDGGDGDITDVSYFDWVACDEPLHDHTKQPKIDLHIGTIVTNEFWIHVNPDILPDTVVIDYGLPVNIHPLTNDPILKDISPVFIGIAAQNTDIFDNSYTGTYGDAVIDVNKNLVKYTIKTMEMNAEETFAYAVKYDFGKYEKQYDSTITVIPATTIYYEDNYDGRTNLITYDVAQIVEYDSAPFTTNDPADIRLWQKVGTENTDAIQAEDRPGTGLSTVDANHIYGYDGEYTDCAAFSNGSAMKVTVGTLPNTNVQTYATATFQFYGTGFDVISLTSDKTGTIVVQVNKLTTDTDGKITSTNVQNLIVDTYYGYKWAQIDSNNNGDIDSSDNYAWVVDENASDSLYQVPIIKAEGLEYGNYEVVITASYAGLFDHEQYDGEYYDFYLDAIRIYDPANDGAGNQVIEGAYVADGEGWPDYHELRNMLITANDFDSLNNDTDTIPGIIFIDGNSALQDSSASSNTETYPNVDSNVTEDTLNNKSFAISDYANYGPNNELYLAPGQAISFVLNMTGNFAQVHLAMKSVGDTDGDTITDSNGGTTNTKTSTAEVKVYDANVSNADTVTEQIINTATDLYYDITNLNNKNVVIVNTGETGDAILSITNIKVTYKTNPSIPGGANVEEEGAGSNESVGSDETTGSNETEGSTGNGDVSVLSTSPFVLRRADVEAALRSLNNKTEAPEEPETSVPETSEATEADTSSSNSSDKDDDEDEEITTAPATTEAPATEPAPAESPETEPEADSTEAVDDKSDSESDDETIPAETRPASTSYLESALKFLPELSALDIMAAALLIASVAGLIIAWILKKRNMK